ncbi:Uncharacterised protein [Vibrio cholerae]|uniref:Uncharacterized protein n=1 Tax=Vibrio cholerae TaxID=666 RepID=A0A655WM91_VIBCL|nr:Uncharacterised protein [Vibrio cholerae]
MPWVLLPSLSNVSGITLHSRTDSHCGWTSLLRCSQQRRCAIENEPFQCPQPLHCHTLFCNIVDFPYWRFGEQLLHFMPSRVFFIWPELHIPAQI